MYQAYDIAVGQGGCRLRKPLASAFAPLGQFCYGACALTADIEQVVHVLRRNDKGCRPTMTGNAREMRPQLAGL